MITKVVFFICIITLQIYKDPTIQDCKSKSGTALIIFHHALQLFFIFGSFVFGYHKIHLIILILAFITHITYKMCPLTIIHNKLCEFDKNNPLITFINHAVRNSPNSRKHAVYTYYFILFIIMTYDIVSIKKP
jgi:hypothetical protein